MTKIKYDVANLKLAAEGRKRIEWAERNMPVLRIIRERFKKEKPFKGVNMACCLHVTTETAGLMRTLKAGGANAALCASNPLSTQDDVAASLVKDYKISVFAINAEDNKTYYKHINQALDFHPHITMDDGADLVSTLHSDRRELIPEIIGGTEETTTGVPSISLTTGTAPDSQRLTALFVPPICFWPGRRLLSPVMAGADAGLPCGPKEWAPMLLLPRSTIPRRSRRRWMDSG